MDGQRSEDVSARLRDYARFGEFILGGGKVHGRDALAPNWLAQATAKQIDNGHPPGGYGYFWWVGGDGTFNGIGIFGQMLHIDPRRHLVVAVLAAWPVAYDGAHAAEHTRLVKAIEAAIDREARHP